MISHRFEIGLQLEYIIKVCLDRQPAAIFALIIIILKILNQVLSLHIIWKNHSLCTWRKNMVLVDIK